MGKSTVNILDIEHLAEMSGLVLSDTEKDVMNKEINGILEMFNGCAEADENALDKRKVLSLDDLREDVVESSLDADQVFMNAPQVQNGYIVVPKVVD